MNGDGGTVLKLGARPYPEGPPEATTVNGGTRQPKKIRYTAAEWTVVVERARATGRPPARYVREISLGASPKARRSREHDEIIYELGRIGTTLTRLSTAMKEAGLVSPEASIQAALAELCAPRRLRAIGSRNRSTTLLYASIRAARWIVP
jgi:hypothetical protein